MKWPNSVMLVRHDTSAYNILRQVKNFDKVYREFLQYYELSCTSLKTIELAKIIQKKFSLGVGDANTPLADAEGEQAYQTGLALSQSKIKPEAIFLSPYNRVLQTFDHLLRGWPELASIKVIKDDRIREQEHGLALLCNDWRVFHTLYPEQRKLYEIEGPYWYRYPQGENVPDVRLRNLSWLSTLTRDFAEQNVLVVTHHLNILAMRANLERWDAGEFIRVDHEEKPINCGVTLYKGYPKEGRDGHLKLKYYNRQYYK